MNQVNKEIQRNMNLKQVGASFFDTTGTVKYGQHRLEIWPGITSTIRSREYDTLICIEPTHKVVRWANLEFFFRFSSKLKFRKKWILTNHQWIQFNYSRNDTAYETLKVFRQDAYKAKQALLGSIVVTRYNNDKTYRIDDINYRESPLSGIFRMPI